jgi:RNA polymerase sigma-70 factor (ECF subfamily)
MGTSVRDLARLIADCTSGDDQARAQFCEEYLDLIRRSVTRKLFRLNASAAIRAELDDICQEVFTKLFADDCRALTRLQHPESVNAWLVTVAQNHTMDYVRRHARRERLHASIKEKAIPPSQADPAQQAAQGERNERIRVGLQAIPARDRLILELYYVQGLKYVEIAEILDLNVNTLSAQLRRAKAKLRRLLEAQQDEAGL